MEKITCPECGQSFIKERKGMCFKSFESHIRNSHGVKIKASEIPERYNINSSYLTDRRKLAREAAKAKWRSAEYVASHNAQLKDTMSTEEYNNIPTCQICNFKASQLYKHISTIHSMAVDDYRVAYPNSPLETVEYIEYLRESRTGENNPMYNNGSPSLSPWSEDFYIKKGHSQKESKQLKDAFVKRTMSNRTASSQPTRKEYYMQKYGVSRLEAMDMVSARQRTNAIDVIAAREGITEEAAREIRNEITNKWISTIESKSDEEFAEFNRRKTVGSVSGISIRMFNILIEELGIDKNEVMMGDNEMCILYDKTYNRDESELQFSKGAYLYDFTYKNKIIEYNGDIYHANPSKYKSTDFPMSRFPDTRAQKWTAESIWKFDKLKNDTAVSKGYDILVIWDSEYRASRADTIEKCKRFLSS